MDEADIGVNLVGVIDRHFRVAITILLREKVAAFYLSDWVKRKGCNAYSVVGIGSHDQAM